MFVRIIHCSRSSIWSFASFHQVQRTSSWELWESLDFYRSKTFVRVFSFEATFLKHWTNKGKKDAIAIQRYPEIMLVPTFKTTENLWKHKKLKYMMSEHCTVVLNSGQLYDTTATYSKRRTITNHIKPITGEKPAVRTSFIANSPHCPSLLPMEINTQEVIGSRWFE